MKVLLQAKAPHEVFNAAIRDGTASKKLMHIIDELKPEAVYFGEFDGHRTALMVVDIKDSSEIPKYAEPWFLLFGGDVQFHPVMTPEDLKRANLEEVAKQW